MRATHVIGLAGSVAEERSVGMDAWEVGNVGTLATPSKKFVLRESQTKNEDLKPWFDSVNQIWWLCEKVRR